MKTKFSFLAMPLCLGMCLVFALAACSTDSKKHNGDDDGSSSSAAPPPPPKEKDPNIEFVNFGLSESDLNDVITLTGTVRAKGKDADENPFVITKLEFMTQSGETQPGWISYDGAKVTGPLVQNVGSISLNKAKIDLKNTSIGCRATPYPITVRACINDKCASEVGEFTKPCPISSSSVAGASSSSQGAWVFDARQTLSNISENAEQTIGTVKFKLNFVENLTISMVGGGDVKIFDMPDIDPVLNQEYTNFNIGSALTGNNSIIPNAPYIICSGNCSSASSERYLIRFSGKLTSPININAEYWKVKRSP